MEQNVIALRPYNFAFLPFKKEKETKTRRKTAKIGGWF